MRAVRRCGRCALPAALLLLLLTPAPAGALFGCGINPLCMIGKGAGGAVSSLAGDAITALAKSVLGALGHAVDWASTLWVGIGTPPVADAGGQATGTVAFLQQNLLVFTTGLAVLCTLLGAGRIVYHEHKAAQLRDLGRYLATYVLVSGAAAGAASVLIGGCDQMASWFITRASAGSGFADHLANLLGLATASTSQAAGTPAGFTVGLAGTVTTAFIAIVLGIIAFLGTVIQIMLMLVRGGMLVLLVGTLPLVAAFSNTEMGLQWFRKASAWLIAFALYKPAAAVVYAVAFDLAGQQGALALLDGVMMLVLAILALPALLRFVVPATSALAGGGRRGSNRCRRGGRGDRDADADGRGGGRSRPGERLRPVAERQRPLGRGARRPWRSRRAGGHARERFVGPGRRERKRRRVGQRRPGRAVLGWGVRRRHHSGDRRGSRRGRRRWRRRGGRIDGSGVWGGQAGGPGGGGAEQRGWRRWAGSDRGVRDAQRIGGGAGGGRGAG